MPHTNPTSLATAVLMHKCSLVARPYKSGHVATARVDALCSVASCPGPTSLGMRLLQVLMCYTSVASYSGPMSLEVLLHRTSVYSFVPRPYEFGYSTTASADTLH